MFKILGRDFVNLFKETRSSHCKQWVTRRGFFYVAVNLTVYKGNLVTCTARGFGSFFLSFFLILTSFCLCVVLVYLISHTQSVELLWASNHPDVETSIWQHTALNKRHISIPPAGFEPAIPASVRPKTHVLHRRLSDLFVVFGAAAPSGPRPPHSRGF